MNINNYLTGVTTNITNQTRKKSITPVIVGNAFTDLANLTKEAVDSLTGSTGNFIQSDSFENDIQEISAKYNNSADYGEGGIVTQEITPDSISFKANVIGEDIQREVNISTSGVYKSIDKVNGDIQSYERARFFNNDYKKGIQSLRQEYNNESSDNKSLSIALNFNTENIDDLGDNDVIECELLLPRESGKLATQEWVITSGITGVTFTNLKSEIPNNTSTIKTDEIPNVGTYIELLSRNTESTPKERKIRFGTHESDQFTITDGITEMGLTYAENYGNNFNERSLIDKEWAEKSIVSKYSGVLETNGTNVQFSIPKSSFYGKTTFNSTVVNINTFINNYTTIVGENVIINFETAPLSGSTLSVNILGFTTPEG